MTDSSLSNLEAKIRIASVATNSTTPSALAAPQLNWSSRIAVICMDTRMTFPPPNTAGVT